MTSTIVRLAKEKGAKLYRESSYSESADAYSVAIDNANGDDSELHLYFSNRCACYMQLGLYDKAKDDAESCTMMKPTWAKGYTRLGSCLLELKKPQEAVYAFERAVELDASRENSAALSNARNILSGGRSTRQSTTTGNPREPSFARNQSTASPTDYSQILTNTLESVKMFFSKMIARLLLFYTEITDMQKMMILVAVLGCIFYFLIYSDGAGRSGRTYAGSDNYRTDRPTKSYNDPSYPDYTTTNNAYKNNQEYNNVHNDNRQYQVPPRHAENHGNRNYYSQHGNRNYGSGNYGFEGMTWGVWGAIIAAAYKLPPYFPGVLGPDYAKPFFGMSWWNFTMVLNMVSNAMGGRRGRGMGGGIGSFFPRRRY